MYDKTDYDSLVKLQTKITSLQLLYNIRPLIANDYAIGTAIRVLYKNPLTCSY